MHRRVAALFAITFLCAVASCGGSERVFDTGTPDAGRKEGGGGASSDSGSSTGGSTSDSGPNPGLDATSDSSVAMDATQDAARDVAQDVPPDVPKSCVGPPSCSNAKAQASCTGIRGCYWSQCVQKNAGFVYSCGQEGPDPRGSTNCPPGCHVATNGNCVGVTGDYYGGADPCGSTTRQTHDTCVGPSGLWQSCVWNTVVACVGVPTLTDCSGITDSIICAQEGCVWR